MNDSHLETNPPPVTKTGAPNRADLLSRVVVILLLAASVGLLWWSYSRVLVPRLKESREYNATVNRLSLEVETLDRRWPKAAVDRIDRNFELAQPRLFADQSALENWLADFRKKLAPAHLDFKTELGKNLAPPGADRGLFVISGIVIFDLQSGSATKGAATPYQQLLRLTQRITSQEKRADLTELTVDGGTNSIGHAVMAFNFWTAGKESK